MPVPAATAWYRARRWPGAFLLLAATGCASPSEPVIPPDGGQDFELSYAVFQQSILPAMEARGCRSTDCHGGEIRGTFELAHPDAPNAEFDFEQVRLQVTPLDPAASPILTKPLASEAGGAPHSFEPFADASDPDYQTILAWIEDGELR